MGHRPEGDRGRGTVGGADENVKELVAYMVKEYHSIFKVRVLATPLLWGGAPGRGDLTNHASRTITVAMTTCPLQVPVDLEKEVKRRIEKLENGRVYM